MNDTNWHFLNPHPFDRDRVLASSGVSKSDFARADQLLGPMLKQLNEIVDYTPDYPSQCKIRELEYLLPTRRKAEGKKQGADNWPGISSFYRYIQFPVSPGIKPCSGFFMVCPLVRHSTSAIGAAQQEAPCARFGGRVIPWISLQPVRKASCVPAVRHCPEWIRPVPRVSEGRKVRIENPQIPLENPASNRIGWKQGRKRQSVSGKAAPGTERTESGTGERDRRSGGTHEDTAIRPSGNA